MRRLQTFAVVAFLVFFGWQIYDIRVSIEKSMERRERIAERCETSVHKYMDRLTPSAGGVIDSATTTNFSTGTVAPVLPADMYP